MRTVPVNVTAREVKTYLGKLNGLEDDCKQLREKLRKYEPKTMKPHELKKFGLSSIGPQRIAFLGAMSTSVIQAIESGFYDTDGLVDARSGVSKPFLIEHLRDTKYIRLIDIPQTNAEGDQLSKIITAVLDGRIRIGDTLDADFGDPPTFVSFRTLCDRAPVFVLVLSPEDIKEERRATLMEKYRSSWIALKDHGYQAMCVVAHHGNLFERGTVKEGGIVEEEDVLKLAQQVFNIPDGLVSIVETKPPNAWSGYKIKEHVSRRYDNEMEALTFLEKALSWCEVQTVYFIKTARRHARQQPLTEEGDESSPVSDETDVRRYLYRLNEVKRWRLSHEEVDRIAELFAEMGINNFRGLRLSYDVIKDDIGNAEKVHPSVGESLMQAIEATR